MSNPVILKRQPWLCTQAKTVQRRGQDRRKTQKSQKDCHSCRPKVTRGCGGHISKRENAVYQATEVMLQNCK